MYYEARITYRGRIAYGTANTDHEAVKIAERQLRPIQDAGKAELWVYHVSGNEKRVTYATTLGAYRIAIS